MPAPPAFTYEVRRGGDPPVNALAGTDITLDERLEYLLRFPCPLSVPEQRRLVESGGEFLRDDLAVVSFRNFVGRTSLAGVGIQVVSTKVAAEGVSRILEEVSAVSAGLVFGRRSPTTFMAASDATPRSPVPFHQLQFLREVMLRRPSGQRLQDWLHVIESHPTRRFERDRTSVPVARVRRLDSRAIQSVFSEFESLVPLPAGVRIAESPLARRLTFGAARRSHFPVRVNAPGGRLSFDTPENRFVRHVLSECVALIHRFVVHPDLHDSLKADCRTMLALLEPVASAPFIAEAGRLVGLQAPNQVLAKADGYREVFGFWHDLMRHVSYPRGAVETVRLLAGRDMGTLYEYWVFAKILETVVGLTGGAVSEPPSIRRDEWGERLGSGVAVALGPELEVGFNLTFSRSGKTAYSTPLRPDVTLRVGNALHAFDAKYRLDRLDTREDDPDDDPTTYKRADLYKMHTYRDAISGLRTAFVVYPGSEFVFFERNGARHAAPTNLASADGVGAVPLRPADTKPAATLRGLLRVLLNAPRLSP